MYIRQLRVTNYRSLKTFRLGELKPFVVLYGENDCGKSNVLFFLEQVFRQKYMEEVTELAEEERKTPMTPRGFWRGEINDFTDNFFKNSGDPITFSILIRFYRDEILRITTLPKDFLKALPGNRPFDHLMIEGQIKQIDNGERANMLLNRAEFNKKVFFERENEHTLRYLPDFGLETGEALDVFNNIMGKLDDAFLRIPNNRYLVQEKEMKRNEQAELNPSFFKNWLFQRSVDRETQGLFRQISQQFSLAPFEYGRISISRVGDSEIEILVENRDGLKLPIGRKGTGVQQILTILSYINRFSSPLVGIEELEINLSPKSQTHIFNSLLSLVNNKKLSRINQIFLTTHSPHIARRNDASRRGVWMDEKGETKASKPSEDKVEDFFKFPWS